MGWEEVTGGQYLAHASFDVHGIVTAYPVGWGECPADVLDVLLQYGLPDLYCGPSGEITCASFTSGVGSEYFSFDELRSQGAADPPWAIIRDALHDGLDCMQRNLNPESGYGDRLRITSAYRTPAYNHLLYISRFLAPNCRSPHMRGWAADIDANEQTWGYLADLGRSCGACVEPLEESGPGHVHVDWRPEGCPEGW